MDQKKKSNVIVTRYNDELYHWKYIKKVKTKNGKWRYIYDKSELKKYEAGGFGTDWYRESHKYNNLEGEGETTYKRTNYGRTDRLFDYNETFRRTKYGRLG